MQLITYPSEFLTEKTKEISPSQIKSQGVFNLIQNMRRVTKEKDGIGLAANQLGYPASIILVLNTIMINPKILSYNYHYKTDVEGCLSIPGKIFSVRRPTAIEISFINTEGEMRTENLFALEAMVAQHELDHLNGITLMNNPASKEIKQIF